MGSAYERELKAILSGDRQVLERVTRAGPSEQAEAYHRVLTAPFLVVRAAGSLGQADLVAMRSDVSFPIEVKSSTREVIHFSESNGALHDQAVEMAEAAARAGVIALYAFRLKNVRADDAWRVFTLPADGLTGRARILHSRIPDMSETAAGRFVMRWAEGLPLHKLLDYLCQGREPRAVAPAAVTA